MYAFSKQLLKLSVKLSHESELLDKAFLTLETADQQEQNLLLEIVGGAVNKFCLYDEVVYLQKALKSMPHLLSNDPTVVMKADNGSTVTLFDRADQKFIEVPHSLLEPVSLLK